MRPLDYVRAADEAEACRLAAEKGSTFLGGGTDLLPRLKAWLVPEEEVSRLVSLRFLPEEEPIRETPEGGAWISGRATLSQVLGSEMLAERFPILGEALRDAATPQLRNTATVAGNLLQRSRCPYYRTPDAFDDCLLKGGGGCPARDGESRHAAVFSTGLCVSAHPSDLAPALLALGARLEIRSPRGETGTTALQALYDEPTEVRSTEHLLEAGSLVRGVVLPPPAGESLQSYRKGMDRATWSFALASVALVLDIEEGRVAGARMWLGSVAPIPWEAQAAAAALEGAEIHDGRPAQEAIDAAVDAVVQGARPLPRNRYKLPLLQGLLRAAF